MATDAKQCPHRVVQRMDSKVRLGVEWRCLLCGWEFFARNGKSERAERRKLKRRPWSVLAIAKDLNADP